MRLTNRHLLNQYFKFNRKDRNAVLILCVLILFAIAGNIIASRIQLNSKSDFTEIEKAIQDWENQKISGSNYQFLFSFNPNTISNEKLDSLLIPRFVKSNIINYRKAGGRFNKPADLRKIYGMTDSIFSVIEEYILLPDAISRKVPVQTKVAKTTAINFDPNTADIKILTASGFNKFQAKNIIKYREKGGVFHQPSDLLRIYGIDSTFYSSIENYIQISPQSENKPVEVTPEIFHVELNSADSIQLLKLNGVGPVFASRIIKYRNLLGGFYTKEQLLEVYNFSEETYVRIENNVSVDTTLLKKIRINFAGFTDLVRHPYLKKEQVKVVLDFRDKAGAYKTINQLNDKKLLDEKTFHRIKPYLSSR